MVRNPLELGWVARIRQNHSPEHATLHILARRFPHLPLGGRTAPDGFYILGAPDAPSVEAAAVEALASGESGKMVCWQHGEIARVALEEGLSQMPPLDLSLYELAKTLAK